MSTRINTNVTAENAAYNLSLNSNKLSQNIQRLSSGLRINSASDDPSGLVISQNLQAQIGGIEQATSNSNDAINTIKTGEGALNEVQGLLQSIRTLAVHASNLGVNDSTDLQADQTQINSALASINRIASTTAFGNKHLLDGSASSTGTTTNGSAALAAGATAGTSILAQGANSTTGTQTLNVTGATYTTNASATAAGLVASSTFDGSLTINGASYSVGSALAATTGSAVSLAGLNQAIASSGYQATISATKLVLTATSAGAPPTPATFDVSGLGFQAAGGNALTGATTALANGGGAVQGTNAAANLNGVTNASSVTTNGGNTIFGFSNGLQVQVATPAANAASSVYGTINTVAGTTTKGQDLQFQIGANAGQTASVGIGSVSAGQLGSGAAAYTDQNGNSQTVTTANVGDINVTNFKGAQDAIAVVDQAISQISTLRANLGAFQSNVLQSNVRSLGVADQNLQASKSQITDTDLSAEVVDYTKNQILVQAGTSALSYANQAPQAILKLLQ